MRNRAKCKKCGDILESFHRTDLVACSCGEISIYGGQVAFECAAKNWNNFLRVNDEDTEICVRVVDKLEENSIDNVKPLDVDISKEDKLKALDDMIKSYENLPSHAMSQPITHYEVLSVLLLVKSLFSD
jgi:hypothetical protein